MGILKEPAALVAQLSLPAGFSVCELGDQMMAFGPQPQPAEAFYRGLGCGRYVSIDGNGRGTLTLDLNKPIDAQLQSERLSLAFDLVTDFGTGEHIFDQAQVWRTMHELTKPGGYIAFDRPSQGYGKHGFYLTDESLFRDLAQANAYELLSLRRKETPRGWLVRGVFRRSLKAMDFRVPQQGRYHSTLRFAEGAA